jgi:uncharacterized protein
MKTAILGHLGPFSRIVFVLFLLVTGLIIAAGIGILLAFPLFHVNLLADVSKMSDLSDPASINVMKFLQVMQSVGLFLFPPLLAGFLFERKMWDWLGIRKGPGLRMLIVVVLLMFVSIPFISWLVSVNESMKLPVFLGGLEHWMQTTEEEAAQLTTAFLDVSSIGGFLVNLLMIALLPAVGEELLFRGLLQRLFADWFRNIHVAVFFTAFIFGAVHLQFYGMLPRMLLGVMFGYLYYWTGSLWVPVFAHLLNNGAVVVAAFLSKRGIIGTGYENFGSTDNFFVLAGSFVLSALILTYVFRRKIQKGRIQPEDGQQNEQEG